VPAGNGADCMAHALPFQPSANKPSLVGPPVARPTAMHAVEDAHETPFSTLCTAWLGLGVDWIDQVVPFQNSASVTMLPVIVADPTPVQAVGETHETPARELNVAPVGPGSDCMAQVVPFHTSASGLGVPRVPTAVQALEEAHETASRLLLTTPVGLGADCDAHVDPFQASTKGTAELEPV
jgi:hypothetical protein